MRLFACLRHLLKGAKSLLSLFIADMDLARLKAASEKFQCCSITNSTIEGEEVSVTFGRQDDMEWCLGFFAGQILEGEIPITRPAVTKFAESERTRLPDYARS